MSQIRALTCWLLVVLALLLLAGCQPPPFLSSSSKRDMPHCEELAQNETTKDSLLWTSLDRENVSGFAYERAKPGVVVVGDSDEIAQISLYLREGAIETLRKINFDRYIVMIAFSGTESSGSLTFCLSVVDLQNQVLTLHSNLIRSAVESADQNSYYHMIELPRDELPKGEITIRLMKTIYHYYGPVLKQEQGVVATTSAVLP